MENETTAIGIMMKVVGMGFRVLGVVLNVCGSRFLV